MNVKQWYDRVFGNRDGKFTAADLPNRAVLIVGGVVDLVILFAEYRVYSVGYHLTENVMLALGFVAVSCLPFYLGQIAFLYNKANDIQQWIAGGLVVMGLFAGAYYGFADYIISTNSVLTVANGAEIPVDVSSLYFVAVACTVALVVAGLVYVLVDDEQTNKRRANKIEGRAKVAEKEIEIKQRLLAKLKQLRETEIDLQTEFGEDYNALQAQFEAYANSKQEGRTNPQRGNGK